MSFPPVPVHQDFLGFNPKELTRLLQTLDSTTPIIPHVLIAHFMERAGCVVEDPHVYGMIEAAARAKLHLIIKIARQHAITIGSITTEGTQNNPALTQSSVEFALAQMGVQNHEQKYFVIDDPSRI